MGSTSKPRTIRERVIEFEKEFTDQLEKIEKQITDREKELEDLQLELKFVNEEEYPKALETRILSGDPTEANKLKKLMDKLQDQIQDKQEDLVVYHNIKDRFIAEKIEEARVFITPFNEERDAMASTAYQAMMKAKKAYVDVLRKDSQPLHSYYAADRLLQSILDHGSITKPMTHFPMLSSRKHSERMFHGNIYLPITAEEVTRFIKGTEHNEDLDYLPAK
ncbi:hypothetical protein COK43_10350 [Bacillus cereus]|nr:hypothetical protein COK43_10350 [Bacillus cereus]PGQ80474.1 hypothetical protein COA15_19900 [Bacillus anthracis]